ncbi:MAG: DUF1501 domain-containing protein [Pirellulales bacterium]|nr:DUF1501 domain-containing protein [Pirellulales bacterium]
MGVSVDRQQVVGRRDFLKGISLAGLAAGTMSWTDGMSLRAGDLRRRGMACIVLWMQGGPSQFETFSPKPGHENGGETAAIDTSVPGIQIADRFPEVAQRMEHLAIIRSMTSKEGNHQRASFLLHTGYAPTASVKHPAFGSICSQQIADAACEIPSFVRIGKQFRNTGTGGFLGVDFDPFLMPDASKLPANVALATDEKRYQRRLGLLSNLDEGYASAGGANLVADHERLYKKTARMVLSSQMKAFKLDEESSQTRAAYGETEFGNGCLLARRLIESGVTFVEVSAGSWDTHDDVFGRTKNLAGQVDRPFAALIDDLQDRGLLDSTLVVWMGEFGRTPKINPRVGRDHYPRSFNVVLGGGGIKGGQVIGATDEAGVEPTERPVAVTDLFQSLCQSLKIDGSIENMSPIGRPIRIVDGGSPVMELFG